MELIPSGISFLSLLTSQIVSYLKCSGKVSRQGKRHTGGPGQRWDRTLSRFELVKPLLACLQVEMGAEARQDTQTHLVLMAARFPVGPERESGVDESANQGGAAGGVATVPANDERVRQSEPLGLLKAARTRHHPPTCRASGRLTSISCRKSSESEWRGSNTRKAPENRIAGGGRT